MNPLKIAAGMLFSVSCSVALLVSAPLRAQQPAPPDTVAIRGQTTGIYIPAPAPPATSIREESLQEIQRIDRSLREELEAFVQEMKSQDYISDNVVPELDIAIIDEGDEPALKVTYSYSLLVDTLTYQTDDFTLGNYLINSSNAVMVTLAVMRSSIERHLLKFLTPHKDIIFTILGSADATPLRSVIAYEGEFGAQISEECLVDGVRRQMQVSTRSGITDNPTLAFMRSYAVRRYIETRIEALGQTNNTFHHQATVSPYTGGRYRRVTIEMVIHNVFDL